MCDPQVFTTLHHREAHRKPVRPGCECRGGQWLAERTTGRRPVSINGRSLRTRRAARAHRVLDEDIAAGHLDATGQENGIINAQCRNRRRPAAPGDFADEGVTGRVNAINEKVPGNAIAFRSELVRSWRPGSRRSYTE